MKRKLIILLVILSCLVALGPVRADAASAKDILVHGAASLIMADLQLNALDKEWQYFFNYRASQTGIVGPDNDPLAYGRFAAIVNQIENANKGILQYNSTVYLSPQPEINGAAGLAHIIHITRGTLDYLSDDEASFIIAHEYGHSEKNHVRNGIKSKLAVGVLVDLYLSKNQNYVSNFLANATKSIVSGEVIDIGKEWEADNLAFDYAIRAGYNPGGGAATFYRARAMYGEGYTTNIALRLKGANNHPPNTERIANFAKLMTDYSGGRVTVVGDRVVCIDGKPIVSPAAIGNRLDGERAYLIAGNLARVFNEKSTAPLEIKDDAIFDAIYIGQLKIMTVLPGDGDTADIVKKLNEARGITITVNEQEAG